ncbi:MAG: hypothetical protein KGH98_02730 [Candidatus Micrarchaeota archaeon]|nr:hypothetical protein [Candidatus Micrarchaeota archaeon]
MTVRLCDRCKREIYRFETCDYCDRKICDACTKSTYRVQKTTRLAICKDCWSNLKKRTAFKNKSRSLVIVRQEPERERF